MRHAAAELLVLCHAIQADETERWLDAQPSLPVELQEQLEAHLAEARQKLLRPSCAPAVGGDGRSLSRPGTSGGSLASGVSAANLLTLGNLTTRPDTAMGRGGGGAGEMRWPPPAAAGASRGPGSASEEPQILRLE